MANRPRFFRASQSAEDEVVCTEPIGKIIDKQINCIVTMSNFLLTSAHILSDIMVVSKTWRDSQETKTPFLGMLVSCLEGYDSDNIRKTNYRVLPILILHLAELDELD